MATKKIAYAIARESTDDRTLQNQYEKLQEFAENHDYTIIRKFGENISGDASKRDGAFAPFIEELKDAIKEKRPDAILIVSLDRLTRTTREQGYFLTEFSSIQKIPMYFAKEDVWTIDPKTGKANEEEMKRLASDTTPQNERENIAARTRPQREKLGSEGYFIGHISDGYCVEESWGTYEDGRRRKIKKIIIDDERKKVIEDIFRYYLNGESTDKISAILNANNVPTANRYRSEHHEKFGYKAKYIGKDKLTYERKNATWSGALVGQILSNEWYKGIRHYRGKELHHQYIIEPEDWEEVKRIREERKISFRSLKESNKHVFLLSNMFYCGKCGCKMYGHYTGLNNHYYCSSLENSQKKCGLKGICKENVEGIISDILFNYAIENVRGGAIDGNDNIINFFKLSKEKESQYKEGIRNNEKIIMRLTAENESHIKANRFLVRQQSNNSDNATRVAMYESEIKENEQAIESNENKILKYKAEIRNYNRMLTANVDIKQILKNIERTKDLNIIRQLFKTAIEKVYLFNTEKKNSIIRIIDKRGGETEVVYSSQRLKGKYIPLIHGLHYNEAINMIEIDKNLGPVIVSDCYAFLASDKEAIELNNKFATHTHIIDDHITVDHYLELLKDSFVALPYNRLEGLSELALVQKEHYRQWRRKYNTGRPKGSEPYIIHNDTYAEIEVMRKRLYNRRYKIKNNKSLSLEEKEKQLNEIQIQLDALTLQVPLIKPRKKRTSNSDEEVEVTATPTIV